MISIKRSAVLIISSMMLALTACAGTTNKESTGEYIDDSVMTAKVKRAIFEEPTLKSSEISVVTFKGDVQLSGFVSTAAQITTAVNIAKRVPGVTSVKNDMRVKGSY